MNATSLISNINLEKVRNSNNNNDDSEDEEEYVKPVKADVSTSQRVFVSLTLSR